MAVFTLHVFTLENVLFPWSNVALLRVQLFTHELASPSVKCHEFLSHLAACLSVCRCPHVTRLKQCVIGQTCNDNVVVHVARLWCLDRCKPPLRGVARHSEPLHAPFVPLSHYTGIFDVGPLQLWAPTSTTSSSPVLMN